MNARHENMAAANNFVTCIFYAIASFIVFTGSESGLCPLNCHCTKNAEQTIVAVNCTNANLSDVPKDLPDTLTSLILSKNSITKLDNTSLNRLGQLKLLDLSRNNISCLPEGCFSGLFSLSKLLLRQNRVLMNNDSVPDGIFKDLKELKVLNMQDNCDPYDPGASYPDKALSELSSLEELHIDGLHEKSFGPGFRKLRSIRLLNLTGSDGAGTCGIEQITEHLFTNFRNNMSYLDLSYCEIRHVHPLAFSQMTGLETVDFSKNRHMGISGVENISYSLTFINVKSLFLSYICRPAFHYVNLYPDAFRFFRNTSLINLDLSSNHIGYIDPDVVDCFPRTLQFLSLRDNYLLNANFLLNMYIMNNLKTIDISYQFQFHISLNASKIDNIEETSTGPYQSDSVLRLNHDPPIALPPNLENMYASHMKLFYPVPSFTFAKNRLKVLDLSSNNAPMWLGPWYGLHSLRMLNISYNGLKKVFPNSFGDMHSLTTLLLAGNSLGLTLYDDKQCLTFANQSRLDTLDLCCNEIKSLPKNLFINLQNLKVLNLKNNSLISIDFKMNQMKRLSTLDLSNNQLTHLSEDTCRDIDYITLTHNLSVKLIGNPLSCSCEYFEFLKWMKRKKTMLADFKKLVCSYEMTTASLNALDNIVEKLQYDCIGPTVVEVCAIAFIGLLLLLTIPAIIYHKRWKLRYLYYMGPRKNNPYRLLEQQNINCNAYISYPDSLRSFVVDKLYPELIRRELLLACSEDTAQGPQSNALTEIIQRCDKTVVLLADDYFTNFWNIFEFHMAIEEGIHTNRETVVPVLFGELRSCDTHPEIMAYFKSNKCIAYPGEGDADEFWEYLQMRINQ